MIITIEFDTEKKMVAVDMGGKKMKDVSSISIYKEYGYDERLPEEYSIHISSSSKMEDGLTEYKSISAKEEVHKSIASALIRE